MAENIPARNAAHGAAGGEKIRHSLAHIMASAVLEVFP